MSNHDAGLETIEDTGATSTADGGRLFVDLGDGTGAIPVRAETGKNRLLHSSHTAVVGFMVVLAAGGIWAMRKAGLGVQSAAAEVPVEIERTAQPVIAAEKFKALMSELERGDHPVQIPMAKLSERSPFELEVEVAKVEQEDEESAQQRAERLARERAQREKKEREEKIKAAYAGLKLFAVVGGRNPAARINMSVVREGDTVADLFTVVEIRSRSVVLECDDKQYELDLAGKSGGH